MPISRVPSFSGRPGFPAGLKVLVVDPDANDLSLAVSQLQQCNYEVYGCETEAEAENVLQGVDGNIDVVLWQTSVVSLASAAKSFLPKIADTPLVLMGENSTQQQMVTGLKLGAVDFLEKPISMLKLRNIWQHTVRKMLKPKSATKITRCPSKTTTELSQPKAEQETAAVPVTAAQPSEPNDESTGSSEAQQNTSESATKSGSGTLVPSCAISKAESRRQVCQQPATLSVAQTLTAPAVAAARSKPTLRAQQPPSAVSNPGAQYCMQGMPAPLPGCVWGLPMLPPPVPGLVGAPTPWSQGTMPCWSQQAQHVSMPPMATSSMSGSLSNQQVQAHSMPSCMPGMGMHAHPINTMSPQSYMLPGSMPHPGMSQPMTAKPLPGAGAVTCTTGSNSNSDDTWQADVWANMEDMFELDDPEDPEAAKLDLNNLLNSAPLHDYDTDKDNVCHFTPDFNLELEAPADGEPSLEDGSLMVEDFDTSFAGLLDDEYDDNLGLKVFKSPSLLDMMDNLCPVDTVPVS